METSENTDKLPETGYLCVYLRPGQSVRIGKAVVILKEVGNKFGRLYIQAPKEVAIKRL